MTAASIQNDGTSHNHRKIKRILEQLPVGKDIQGTASKASLSLGRLHGLSEQV
jgi:hypothetical protein